MINISHELKIKTYKKMKKLLTLAVLLMTTTLSFGQTLYESFNYTTPGNIGGNTNTTDAIGSNNWVTQSNAATGTIDVLQGNLSYNGLTTSTGNKVLLPGNNTTTPRDVNRAFTTTNTINYYSVLINVIDNTQLSSNPSYFMGFGNTSGISLTGYGARLAASTGTNGYKLSIQNTSSGTPTFTEFTTELTYSTTYLVVVKYDTTTTPTTATLWVNPTTLGSTEPSGSVTNNSGTATFTTFASIFLRNNSTTPKVEIDEIRVGDTFASVTPTGPLSTNQNTKMGLIVYPNPVNNGLLNIQTADNSVKDVVVYDLLGKKVLSTSTSNTVNVSSLQPGVYTMKITEENNTGITKIVIN